MHLSFPRPLLCAAAAAGLLLGTAPAAAQQDDEQLWLQANTVVPLNDKIKLTLEQIARFGDRPGGLYTTEFGGIGSYKVASNVEIGFGYRYVDFYNGNTARAEHRLRQHVIASFGPVTTRLRLDERFHPAGDEIGFRFRPLLRYNHKLRSDGLALFVSHESFLLLNSTKWGQRAGYERMRNIAGFAVPIAPGVSGDIGYLNQYRLSRGGARAQMDHALNFQLTINLGALHVHKADD
jgi:hypothetical protein